VFSPLFKISLPKELATYRKGISYQDRRGCRIWAKGAHDEYEESKVVPRRMQDSGRRPLYIPDNKTMEDVTGYKENSSV
jgi:hypothetical protein